MARPSARPDAAPEPPTRRPRPGWMAPRIAVPGAAAILAVAAAATMFAVSMVGGGASSGTFSLFANADTASARQRTEGRPIEVGLRFRTAQAGTVTALRFLRAPGAAGPHLVNLWSADGGRLASVSPAGGGGGTDGNGGDGGWRTATLAVPVRVDPGEYVVSYHTTSFMATDRYFVADGGLYPEPVRSGPLVVDNRGVNGVYGYGPSGFPTRTDRPTNFWVDVVFVTDDVAPARATSRPAGPTTGSAGAATGSAGVAPAPEPSPGPASWASYYRRWRNGPNPTGDPGYFPIGVWIQDPSREAVAGTPNGRTYQDIGVNTDVGIWDDEWYRIRYDGLIRSDWRAFVYPGRVDDVLKETANARNFTGYVLSDEPDMLKMEGDVFHPDRQPSALNALADKVRKQDPSRPTYVNFSKWMASYKGETGYQRIEFGSYEADMRAYCKAADMASADLYGYTDPWEGEDQEGAWAYGELIDNLRRFCGPDKPVWGFVETAQPFYREQINGAPAITPDQMEAAIWNMIVHGANGWVYFSHDFGYGTGEDSMLRKKEIKARAASVNARVRELAPVLNTFSSDGVSVLWSSDSGVPVTLMHKLHGGSHYLFAQTDGNPQLPKSGPTTATIRVPVRSGTAKVLHENRTVPITDGQIVDAFQPYQIHIYQF